MNGYDSSETGTQLANTMDHISSIRQEIISIDKENVKYANQFRELTFFNQAIGDEIANFDVRICEYENRIRQRTVEVNCIKKKTYPILVAITNLRKSLLENLEFRMAVKNLITMEQKCVNLEQRIKTFQSVISENNDPTKSQSLLIDKIQILKESNSDLETQIRIMEMLLNKKNTSSDQDQKAIHFEVKKRQKELKSLDQQIKSFGTPSNSPSQTSNRDQMPQEPIDRETALDLFGEISEDSESLVPESESIPSCIVYQRQVSTDSEVAEPTDEDMNEIEKLKQQEENWLKLIRFEEYEKLKETEEQFLIHALFESDEDELEKKVKKQFESIENQKLAEEEFVKKAQSEEKEEETGNDSKDNFNEKEKMKEEEFVKRAKIEQKEEEIKRKEMIKLRKAIQEEKEEEAFIYYEKIQLEEEQFYQLNKKEVEIDHNENEKNSEEMFVKTNLHDEFIEEIERVKNDEEMLLNSLTKKTKKKRKHRNKQSKYLPATLEISEFPHLTFPPNKIVISDDDLFSDSEMSKHNEITNQEISQKEELLKKKQEEYQLKKQMREKLNNNLNSIQSSQNSKTSINFKNGMRAISKNPRNQTELAQKSTSSTNSSNDLNGNSMNSRNQTESTHNSKIELNENLMNSTIDSSNNDINSFFDLFFGNSEKNLNDIAVQTKKNGQSIDNLVERLEKKRQDVIEINQLKEELEVLDQQIENVTHKRSEVDEKNKNYDEQIIAAKSKHVETMSNSFTEKSRTITSFFSSTSFEFSFDSSSESDTTKPTQRSYKMMAEYHQKRLELNRILIRTKEYEQKLEQLQRRRSNIEKEIYDLDHREKPEVVKLTNDVSVQKLKSMDINIQLQKSQEELIEKRKILEELRQSDLRNQYYDLLVQKSKIGRRILKWKMFLADADETMQYLESFSSNNYQRRQALSQTLQNIEREKFMKNEQAEELKSYSNLLGDLIKAYPDIMNNYKL